MNELALTRSLCRQLVILMHVDGERTANGQKKLRVRIKHLRDQRVLICTECAKNVPHF